MSAHLKAQLLRFARATGYAFIAAFLATGGSLSWWQLLSLVAGAVESGLRQVFQVQEVATVTAVPAPPGGTP